MEDRFKYVRTYHADWSDGLQNDDRRHPNKDIFLGMNVVVTEKLDGENTTMYRDFYHARSIDSGNNEHPNLKASRSWVKQLHGQIKNDIPEGYRMCGENVYAHHSILYKNLTSYFYLFSAWKGWECLSWDDTVEWAALLGLKTVPVLYEGIYDESIIRSLYSEKNANGDPMEGYVIRPRRSFIHDPESSNFCLFLMKFVRRGHVQTDQHWRDQPLVANGLINE
jgi:hypothetical protein